MFLAGASAWLKLSFLRRYRIARLLQQRLLVFYLGVSLNCFLSPYWFLETVRLLRIVELAI